MFGHFEPVNHCCFSPDDKYLSTSSNDGTLKVTAISPDTCFLFDTVTHTELEIIISG